MLTVNYHIRPDIETIKKYTAIMQYLDTHLDTCVNANMNDPMSDINVRGMEWYMFGEDPIYNYECESWIDDFTIEEVLNEEFQKLCHTIEAISATYTGIKRHDILYEVLMSNGACGRAMVNCKMFIDYDGKPGSYENGGLSLYDIIYKKYDNMEEEDITLYKFPFIGEFISVLHDIIMEEVDRMVLVDRYIARTDVTIVGENMFTTISNVDRINDTVFNFIKSGEYYAIQCSNPNNAAALRLALWSMHNK